MDTQFPENLHDLHDDLQFLPERVRIEKFEKLVATLHGQTEYIIHIRNLKQTSNHRLVFKRYIEWLYLMNKNG